MSDPETTPTQVHREATLLPWYVNGTLSESERQLVDQHLSACAVCRAERDELTRLKVDLETVYAAQPGPSSLTSRSVIETVAREASPRRMAHPGPGAWLKRVDGWLRSLLLPRWVPTLVAVLLVAQVGLLLWTSAPGDDREQVRTRSLGRPGAIVLVVFQQAATEGQIRSLLQTVHGRMIDGPTTGGAYTIELAAADQTSLDKTLTVLRKQGEVVRSAEALRP